MTMRHAAGGAGNVDEPIWKDEENSKEDAPETTAGEISRTGAVPGAIAGASAVGPTGGIIGAAAGEKSAGEESNELAEEQSVEDREAR
jgi:hypothetical protein